MANRSQTRAVPVSLDELRQVLQWLQSSARSVGKLIESMEMEDMKEVKLRWKTRYAAAQDWHVFAAGLQQAMESQKVQNAGKKAGENAKTNARKNRDSPRH